MWYRLREMRSELGKIAGFWIKRNKDEVTYLCFSGQAAGNRLQVKEHKA